MNSMTVCFWGTRGSIPTPGPKTAKYGGNTTCLEVRHCGSRIVVDAGSGIRELDNAWRSESKDARINATLLFTHLHQDHIQGFPFFSAAYDSQNSFVIYGPGSNSQAIGDLLGQQMQKEFFPVPLSAMRANLDFRNAIDRFQIDAVTVRTLPLPHKGGCLSYRLEAGDAVFIMATDSELDQAANNKQQLETDFSAQRIYDDTLLEFFRGAGLLVIDCQYTDEEYRERAGWGHNSITTVVDLCQQVRPEKVALFHHDPESSDAKVAEFVAEVRRRLSERGISSQDVFVFAAREQMTVRVSDKSRPSCQE
mgnify:CR=1 FL=1